MTVEAAFSALHELVLGVPAPRELLDLLGGVYRDAVDAAEVTDDAVVRAKLAEVVERLVARRSVREPAAEDVRRAFAELLPSLPHFLPCTYEDVGEWLRLSLPNGWYVHVSREVDTLEVAGG